MASIFILVVLTLLFIYQGQCEPTWDREGTVEVLEGEDITLKCSLQGLTFLDIPAIKKLDPTGENSLTYYIAEHDVIKSPFVETGRYTVNKVKHDANRTTDMILTIQGAKGADSGKLGCEIMGDPAVHFITLNVKVPITEVYISTVDAEGVETRHTDASAPITLKQNQNLGVSCMAVINGSSVEPTVTIRVGSQDQTAIFTAEPRAMTTNPNSGLPTRSAEKKMIYTTDNPSSDFNNQQLICEASIPGTEAKTAQVQLNVEFKPIISCSQQTHQAKIGSDIDISCNVQSNPASNITWLDSEGISAIDTTNTTNGITITEESTDELNKQAILQISNVTKPIHFTSYMLRAANTIGNSEIIVTLREKSHNVVYPPNPDPKPEAEPNSGGVSMGENSAKHLQGFFNLILVCLILLPAFNKWCH